MKKLIVHVDDDPDIRATIYRVLTDAGFEVRQFATIQHFMNEISTISPSLMLLDVMVEQVDSGLTAYTELHKRFPHIQIVFLTTLGDMIRPYFEDGKDRAYILEKPILPEVLVDIVKSRLAERESVDTTGENR